MKRARPEWSLPAMELKHAVERIAAPSLVDFAEFVSLFPLIQ